MKHDREKTREPIEAGLRAALCYVSLVLISQVTLLLVGNEELEPALVGVVGAFVILIMLILFTDLIVLHYKK